VLVLRSAAGSQNQEKSKEEEVFRGTMEHTTVLPGHESNPLEILWIC